MKFNRIFKSVLFVLAAFFILWGCSEPESEETGSISFTISGDVADAIETAGAQSSYRSVNTSNLFFKISIKGDYEAEKTIAATAGSTATFDGIPVYKRIHAEASAYEQNSDGTHNVLYTGTSNTIVIRKGTNTLTLALQATGNTSSSGGGSGTGGSSGGGSGTGGGGSTTPTPTQYSITYQLNEGTNASSNPSTYTSADLPLTLAIPTKSGCSFDGWYTTDDFQDGTIVDKITTTTAGNYTTLYAKWTTNVVGHILLTDGTYITSTVLTTENIQRIVGIVYDLNEGTPSGVLGIKNTGNASTDTLSWAKLPYDSYKTLPCYQNQFTSLRSTWSDGSISGTDNDGGYNNWAYIRSIDPTGTSSANAETNYPAFDYANTYATTAGLTGTSYADGWYMPSLSELYKVYQNQNTITATINAINQIADPDVATTITSNTYLTSSTKTDTYTVNGVSFQQIWKIDFSKAASSTDLVKGLNRNGTGSVCCVHKIETNTIIYILNGGTNEDTYPTTSASASTAAPITLPTPTKSGYTFGGWYTTPDFLDGTSIPNITTANYYTLYAKWTAN